jgi:hypothetical protein
LWLGWTPRYHDTWTLACSLSHWKYDKTEGCLLQSCTFPMKLRMKRAWGFYNEGGGGGGRGIGGISFVGLFESRAILALWLGWTMCYHSIRTLALFSSLLNARCSHSPIELNFLFLIFWLASFFDAFIIQRRKNQICNEADEVQS